MRRLCERPGCGAPAEASYGIDQVGLVVWIDVLEVAERESAGRLCRRHADALEGPRGWTTDDRRQPVPTLFRAATGTGATDGAKRTRREKKPRVAQVDTPSLFESIRRDIEGAQEPAGGGTTEEAPVTARPGDEAVDAGDDPARDEDTGDPAPEAPADGIDPDETKAMPWSPRLGRSSTDDDDRPAFGRLLGRAFGDGAGER